VGGRNRCQRQMSKTAFILRFGGYRVDEGRNVMWDVWGGVVWGAVGAPPTSKKIKMRNHKSKILKKLFLK